MHKFLADNFILKL